MTPQMQYAYKYALDQGYAPHQAAAWAARLAVESGTQLNPTVKGDGGAAYGIAQWHPDRWAKVSSWMQSQGMDPNSREAQLKAALWEKANSEKFAGDALRSAQDLPQAMSAMMHYERPQGYTRANPSGGLGWNTGMKYAAGLLGVDPATLPTSDPAASYTATGEDSPGRTASFPQPAAAPAGNSMASLGGMGMKILQSQDEEVAMQRRRAQQAATLRPGFLNRPRPVGLLGGGVG